MNQVLQWFSMGGYSAYVWPAYGLVGFTLLITVLNVKNQKKRTQEKLKQWFKG